MAIVIAAPVRLAGVLGLFAFSHPGVSLIPILALATLIGLGNAGSLTGIFAIMADMTDVDELITSIRRPGIVSSMATFIRKIASGMSAAIIGFMLSAVHYDEALANAGMAQSAATQHGIGICFIMAPAILSALLLIVAVLFPMTSEEFDLVQKEVARRKGEDTSVTTEEEKQMLIRRAKEYLPKKTMEYAAIMGVNPTGVKITSARTRFGSCSGKNSICYSWRLMQYPQAAVDYVVVHELAHILHKNHGRDFYLTVERYLPDYRQRRALLKK
jgi:hypothetical protein